MQKLWRWLAYRLKYTDTCNSSRRLIFFCYVVLLETGDGHVSRVFVVYSFSRSRKEQIICIFVAWDIL
jgi:hypothetical protein